MQLRSCRPEFEDEQQAVQDALSSTSGADSDRWSLDVNFELLNICHLDSYRRAANGPHRPERWLKWLSRVLMISDKLLREPVVFCQMSPSMVVFFCNFLCETIFLYLARHPSTSDFLIDVALLICYDVHSVIRGRSMWTDGWDNVQISLPIETKQDRNRKI
jgi:hypothetical protein